MSLKRKYYEMKQNIENPIWYSAFTNRMSYPDVVRLFQRNLDEAFKLFVAATCYDHDPYINGEHVLMILNRREMGFKDELIRFFFAWNALARTPNIDLYQESPFAHRFEDTYCLTPQDFSFKAIKQFTRDVYVPYRSIVTAPKRITNRAMFEFIRVRFNPEVFRIKLPTTGMIKSYIHLIRNFIVASVFVTRQVNFNNVNLLYREITGIGERREILQMRKRLEEENRHNIPKLPDFNFTLNTLNPSLLYLYEPFSTDTARELCVFLRDIVHSYPIDFTLHYCQVIKDTITNERVLDCVETLCEYSAVTDLRRIKKHLATKPSVVQKGYLLGMIKCKGKEIDSLFNQILKGEKLEEIISKNIQESEEFFENLVNEELFSTGENCRLYPKNELVITETSDGKRNVFTIQEICELVQEEQPNPYTREPFPPDLIMKYTSQKHTSISLNDIWKNALLRDFRICLT